MKRPSMDFFANFHILLRSICDVHLLIKGFWSELRWFSSPTSTFFFDQSLTRICWEIFMERSSMGFFANFHILLRSIFDAHLLENFCRATFDGLLRQLPHSSLINFWRASVGKWTSSHFIHILLRSILDAHLVGKFCGAILDGRLCQLLHSSSINL